MQIRGPDVIEEELAKKTIRLLPEVKGILTPKEITALENGKEFQYIIDNVSYIAPRSQRDASEILDQYVGHSTRWHHAPVDGRFSLRLAGHKELEGSLVIRRLLGEKSGEYARSNLRPFTNGTGTVAPIKMTELVVRPMNLGINSEKHQVAAISFYGFPGHFHKDRYWSIHCLRQGVEEE